MSGDFETLEINQPKISYYTKRSENILWLQEKMKEIEAQIRASQLARFAMRSTTRRKLT